jgi:hypothetical protein
MGDCIYTCILKNRSANTRPYPEKSDWSLPENDHRLSPNSHCSFKPEKCLQDEADNRRRQYTQMKVFDSLEIHLSSRNSDSITG